MTTWMETLLPHAVRAVLVLSVLLGALVLYTVLHRLVDLARRRSLLHRAARCEEAAALLVAGELSPQELIKLVSRRDRLLVEELLLSFAGKFSGEVREALTETFTGLGAVSRNKRRIESRRWWIRADAARRLGLMGDPSAIRHIKRLVRDKHPEVRIASARALVELGAQLGVGDLTATLAAPGSFSAIRTADAIMEAGQAAVPGLLQFIEAGTHTVGMAVAIDILGSMHAQEAEGVICRALVHPSKEVRTAACRALGRLESVGAIDHLLAALHDEAWEVRNQAVRAIGRIGDPTPLPLIAPLLREQSRWTVLNAAHAIAGMGPEGLGALERELHEAMLDHEPPDSPRLRLIREVLSRSKSGGGAS